MGISGGVGGKPRLGDVRGGGGGSKGGQNPLHCLSSQFITSTTSASSLLPTDVYVSIDNESSLSPMLMSLKELLVPCVLGTPKPSSLAPSLMVFEGKREGE